MRRRLRRIPAVDVPPASDVYEQPPNSLPFGSVLPDELTSGTDELLARAEDLAARRRAVEAIGLLTDANRTQQDPLIERTRWIELVGRVHKILSSISFLTSRASRSSRLVNSTLP